MVETMSYTYQAEVIREQSQETGPGTFTLYRTNAETEKREVIGQWSVITGGSVLDPADYGGLTPPIDWVMIEPIALRQLEGRSEPSLLARLIPTGCAKSNYSKRTFYNLKVDPFTLIYGDRSSGSIVFTGDDFEQAQQ